MNLSHKLSIRLSEIREEINKLNSKDGELTPEEVASMKKLRLEHGEKEERWRAAVVAEEGATEKAERSTDGEGAELRQLRGKAKLGEYLIHAAGGVALDGAEAELNKALGVQRDFGDMGGIMVPLAFLEDRQALERRADVTTTTAALDGGVVQENIMQRIFGADVLPALGVTIRAVNEGQREVVLLTGGADPAMQTESTGAADAPAATFSTKTLKPKRLSERYIFTVEQAAQVPDLESALRQDLAMAVTAKMSELALGDGDGTGANITGILNRLANPTDPSSETDFDAYTASLAEAVDGKHASMESEVSMIMGVETYRHAAGAIQPGSGESAVEALKRRGRGVMASSFIAAAVSDIQTAFLHAGGAGRVGDSQAFMWPGLELIRDIYSSAESGTVALTWLVLWDLYMCFRADAYKRLEFKLA